MSSADVHLPAQQYVRREEGRGWFSCTGQRSHQSLWRVRMYIRTRAQDTMACYQCQNYVARRIMRSVHYIMRSVLRKS